MALRLAVLSDIHGNALALDAVLDDMRGQGIDQTVCLGDAMQGGPQPAEVAGRLRELSCPIVMGNADDWLLTGYDSGAEKMAEERRKKLEAVREWQLSVLSSDDLAFIAGFQPTISIALEDGCALLCYHGSPRSYDDLILPATTDEEIRQLLQLEEDTFYTGGHTHVQFIRHIGRTFHFNPGSVGLTYRHDQPEQDFRCDPWAEYAILTSQPGRLGLEFRRVAVDVEKLLAIYRASGRPYLEDVERQYRS